MKRQSLFCIALSCLIIIAGCSRQAGTAPVPQATASEMSLQDYYPFAANTKYVYEGHGNEYASFGVIADYMEQNRIQLRRDNGGTQMVTVLELSEGMLKMLLSKGEIYYRENFLNAESTAPEILLKEPLEKGTSWTLPDGRKRYISGVDTDISTPSGDYKAIEVTTETKGGGKTLDYYAPKTGLVKTVFISDGYEVSSVLADIQYNVPFSQSVKLFYPKADGNGLYYIDKTLSFNTNDVTKIAIEKALRDTPAKVAVGPLSPNAKIKSLYLNKDNMVYIDFTQELISEMNAGASTEALILQSIVNTVGEYYGADKVYLTVEGKPYSSGHLAMGEKEYFSVDLSNAKRLDL